MATGSAVTIYKALNEIYPQESLLQQGCVYDNKTVSMVSLNSCLDGLAIDM